VVEIECWLCAVAEAADRDEPRRLGKKDFSLLESLSSFDSGIVRCRNKTGSNEGRGGNQQAVSKLYVHLTGRL
jgi:hypothetical protein